MRSSAGPFAAVAMTVVAAAIASACRTPPAQEPPRTAAPSASGPATSSSFRPSADAMLLLPGVGMSSGKSPALADAEPQGPPPACVKDEDCWSKTCCTAAAPEDCVHGSLARKCAIVEVQCKTPPIRYTCVCDGGTCAGRLAPP
jgi:hypothetical protein